MLQKALGEQVLMVRELLVEAANIESVLRSRNKLATPGRRVMKLQSLGERRLAAAALSMP